MLQSTGCVLDLRGRHRQLELQDSRRQLQYLSQWLGASGPECDWDQINEMVADVDAVCCTAESVCDRGPPVRPQSIPVYLLRL